MSREGVFQNVQFIGQNVAKFQLTPTHVSYANTLVRLIMTGVDVVGFRADIKDDGSTTDVVIEANTTPMTNEMLAHRIGLLPIHVDDPLKWNKDDYEFYLDIVNDTDEVMDVKASDIRVIKVEGDQKTPVPTRTFFRPDPVTGDTCLLATLKPKHATGKPEEIRFHAKASLGNGRENARFIPTSRCTYVYTIDSDEAHIKEVRDEWLLNMKKVSGDQWDQMTSDQRDPIEREFKTLGIKRCYLKNALDEPYSFDFIVESAGILDPTYIVKKGCDAGAALCAKFGDEGGETLPESVLVQPTNKRMLGFDFVFKNQDHTLGNLLQTWIDQNRVDGTEVTFVGYMVPHPLRDEMVITIGVGDGQEVTARRVLKEAARACNIMFRTWSEQWSSNNTKTATAAPVTAVKKKRPVLRT